MTFFPPFCLLVQISTSHGISAALQRCPLAQFSSWHLLKKNAAYNPKYTPCLVLFLQLGQCRFESPWSDGLRPFVLVRTRAYQTKWWMCVQIPNSTTLLNNSKSKTIIQMSSISSRQDGTSGINEQCNSHQRPKILSGVRLTLIHISCFEMNKSKGFAKQLIYTYTRSRIILSWVWNILLELQNTDHTWVDWKKKPIKTSKLSSGLLFLSLFTDTLGRQVDIETFTSTPLTHPNFTTPLGSAASLAAASSAGVRSSPLANPSSNGSCNEKGIHY